MEFINSKNAPEAKGPYSHAVYSGNLLFCSGQPARAGCLLSVRRTGPGSSKRVRRRRELLFTQRIA